MKYFGKKSLSSFFKGLVGVLWYVVLVVAVVGGIIGGSLLFISPAENPVPGGIVEAHAEMFNEAAMDEAWMKFVNLPLAVRLLFVPYFVVLVVLLLKILKLLAILFEKFKDDRIFSRDNADLISKVGKHLIFFSIMTFQIGTLIISVLLLMLCEIFKNGSALQEEHDLTV
jgi:hypothetical protein